MGDWSKNFVPDRANPLRLQNAMRGEAFRSFAEVQWPVAGLAAVGFFIPAIIGLHSALSKTLSTNSEILLAASPRAGSVDLQRLSARRARRRPASLLRERRQPRPAKPRSHRRRPGGRPRAQIRRQGPVAPSSPCSLVCPRRAPRRGPLRGRARPPGRIAAPQMTAAGANTDELFTVSTSPTAISDLNA